jgi:bleomycin hydrolase
MLLTAALGPETLQKFRNDFYADSKNILAQNICTRVDPLDVCLSRKHLEETQHVFTHKV